MSKKMSQYLNESGLFLFKKNNLSTFMPINTMTSHKDVSYWELAKRTGPAILTGMAALFLEAYWSMLIASQALPPVGATLLIITGVALILYGLYQGAKYMSDMQNKPDYEEDVTPVDKPIESMWEKFRRL